MEIGRIIKYHREKNEITQEVLAQGICSKTYLSKIENNVTQASEEIITLLCKRLDIPLHYDSSEELERIIHLLDHWLISIKNKENKKIEEYRSQIVKTIKNLDNPEISIKYHLVSLRYFLYHKKFEESKKIVDELTLIENVFCEEQKAFFLYFTGLYEYLNDEINESIMYYSKAEELFKKLHIHEPELLYFLALSHSRINNTALAIHYSNKALDFYTDQLDFLHSIYLYIILAINFLRLNNYEKTESYLFNALKISKSLNNNDLIANIFHNLGFLYSKKSGHLKAIDYYKQSLELKVSDYQKYTHTLFYLVKEYFKAGNFQEGNQLLDKGIEIASINNITTNFYKLKALKAINNLNIEACMSSLIEEIVPYFENKQNWSEFHEYLMLLSKHYSDLNQYKKAYYYCCKAYKAKKFID